jgi:hypothetical protein
MSRPTEAAPAWMYKDENGNLIVDGEDVGETSDIVTVRKKTVTLTDAEIKALPTTFKDVLPAQGATSLIVPMCFVMTLDSLAGAYGNINSPILLEVMGSPSGNLYNPVSLATLSGFFNDDQEAQIIQPINTQINGGYDIRNDKLMIRVSNGELGNFTGGHANNSATFTTFYSVVPA